MRVCEKSHVEQPIRSRINEAFPCSWKNHPFFIPLRIHSPAKVPDFLRKLMQDFMQDLLVYASATWQ